MIAGGGEERARDKFARLRELAHTRRGFAVTVEGDGPSTCQVDGGGRRRGSVATEAPAVAEVRGERDLLMGAFRLDHGERAAKPTALECRHDAILETGHAQREFGAA